MFSEIDKTIFPDSCEVLEIVPQQHYVFPIYKNGSSSLHESMPEQGWRSILNNDIGTITTPITVYLRPPKERFISGVNTFIQILYRDHKNLDLDTILFFVKNYFFLNRHYCPQFFWLINLSKHINTDTPMMFLPMEDISKITNRVSRAGIVPADEKLLDKMKDFNWSALELYFYLDQLLLDRMGKSFTYSELIDDIRINHREVYDLVFLNTLALTNALSKT